MIKIASLPNIAGALLVCGLSAVPARALATRTFVSGHGADSGACGADTAPCRTFALALTQTAANGEIDVVDSAGYGAVTINKSISIVNDGAGVAGIQTVPGGIGVAINAAASDSVHLRGLTIDGVRSGTNGIQFNSGANLAIENCVIRDFDNAGIFIVPRTSSSFSVSNTIASNNGRDGILVNPQPVASVVVNGVLSKVTANNNNFGIVVSGSIATDALLNATIVDSEASNNRLLVIHVAGAGIVAGGPATAVMVRNSVASNNTIGLEAGEHAIRRVAHSVVTGNVVRGVHAFPGGIIQSYGDNDIDGNTTDNTAILTMIPTH